MERAWNKPRVAEHSLLRGRHKQSFDTTQDKLNTTRIPKVFVAMSGGVDSSVAALLLHARGYNVVGVYMRSWGSNALKGIPSDCADRDAEDARRVASKLSIPFYVWDFEEEYARRVIQYMVQGYRDGITPNPDIMCNKEIKFGLFLAKARSLGADYIATGHYVTLHTARTIGKRTISANNPHALNAYSHHLYEAKDTRKDQSYFLWTLTERELAHCLFPIGDFLKPEVRKIARDAGLPTAEINDSLGICFLGKITLSQFLNAYIPEKQGIVVDTNGERIGEHCGAHFYTIGQRHGLASGNWIRKSKQKERKPFYVSEKNIATNILVVAEGTDNPALYKTEARLTGVNLIQEHEDSSSRMRVLARVRYRQSLSHATLARTGLTTYTLTFATPQKFVAAGQSAVFYTQEKELLGGGIIS